jgi:hypothetical protein
MIVNCGMKEKHIIQMRNKYSPQLSKLLYNCKLKNKEAHSYFKGLSEDGGGRIFLKSSATLPSIKINRMSLISAGSISLDSTFKALSEQSW